MNLSDPSSRLGNVLPNLTYNYNIYTTDFYIVFEKLLLNCIIM